MKLLLLGQWQQPTIVLHCLQCCETVMCVIAPGKSLWMHYLNPGKPFSLMLFDPGKTWKTLLKCHYEPWCW